MGNMSITANAEQFLFSVDGVDQRLRVTGFSCTESISAMFQCSVRIAIKGGAELKAADVLGKYGTVELLDEHGSHSRFINGLVATFIQTEKDNKFTHYEMSLIPDHAVLRFRTDCRIFQNKTIEEIIKAVFDDAGVPSDMTRFELSGVHKPREYCVQYNESDLAFIERLMAEEGAFYYFEHNENLHTMVIADRQTVHTQISGQSKIPYHEQTGLKSAEDYVTSFGHVESIGTGAIALTDYNYTRPTVNLLVQGNSTKDEKLAVYEYPGKYPDIDGGKLVAKQWIEGIEAHRQTFSGNSTVRRFIAGFYFTLADHPQSNYNQDFLLTHTQTSGSQPGVLEEASSGSPTECNVHFGAIPLNVPFRSPVRPSKTLVHSIQTAVVVGPAGEEIYTDELGRVKIQFHWDRVGTRDEKSSCWVRVSQLWAGEGWGAIYIPRIGQEVIVSFVDGDPHRPLITGRVYHGDFHPPYPLPSEKNKSAIRSNTTPGGGTFNELMMDDTKDKTRVHLTNAYGHKLTQDEENQFFQLETRDNNKIRMDDKEQFIEVTTTNGHKARMDDKNKQIAIVSTDGYSITLNDKEEQMQAKTKNGHIMTFDDKNKKVELVTTSGHILKLDDDKKNMGMTTANGHQIIIDDSKGMINLEDSNGQHRVKIDINGGKIQISTDTGAIEISASAGNIDMKAMNINIEAQMELKMKGMNVTSEAGVNQQVKGTMVTVEAGGPNTIKGTPVMIN